jgi:hypothetical protein
MSDRIETALTAMHERINGMLEEGKLTGDKMRELSEGVNMTIEEHGRFQELKSAVMGIHLSKWEAQTLYHRLGNTVDVFNRQPLATKIVLTQIFAELMEKQYGFCRMN